MSILWRDLWVCRCCMLVHANGECCPDDEHGGDGVAPWSEVDYTRFDVTMGLLREEHAEGCDPDGECDCERREFSTSRCDGCGSWLAGERHAASLWRVRRRFPRMPLPA